MASTIKVTNINTPDGTGNIIVDRPLSGSGASLTALPAANLTGTLPAISGTNLTNLPAASLTGTIADARFPATLPAISGANLTNLPAGGDTRNFIIDGDFTQWPEGDKTAIAHAAYGPALWRNWSNGGGVSAVKDIKQSTDVPTVAQSGHQSKYSCHIDVTTADAAVAASDIIRFGYQVTGSDFAYLHQQQVTLAFWVKDTKTGSHAVSFHNSAVNRSYVAEYTITTTNTWEYKTITLTMDTAGTFLFTEADIGLFIFFGLMVGTDKHATANTWTAGQAYATSSTVNSMDNTSNNFHLSQVGLYLGATAPTFLGESIATVKDQVSYYIQRYDLVTSGQYFSSGSGITSTASQGPLPFFRRMRIPPIMSSTAANTFKVAINYSEYTGTSLTFGQVGTESCRFTVNVASGLTGGHGLMYLRDGGDTCFIQMDARH